MMYNICHVFITWQSRYAVLLPKYCPSLPVIMVNLIFRWEVSFSSDTNVRWPSKLLDNRLLCHQTTWLYNQGLLLYCAAISYLLVKNLPTNGGCFLCCPSCLSQCLTCARFTVYSGRLDHSTCCNISHDSAQFSICDGYLKSEGFYHPPDVHA